MCCSAVVRNVPTVRKDPGGWWYVPPDGPLYEFEDALVDGSCRVGAKRWLAGFNGRVGEPAENVQLAWRSPTGARTVIGTFPPGVDARRSTHHFNAACQLDSVQFYQPGPPATPTLRGFEHLLRLSQNDSLWLAWDLTVDAIRVPAFVTTVDEETIAHSQDGSVVVVGVGLPPDQLRVRLVTSPAAGYPVDPWRPQTVAALDSEWNAFFQDRPDLVPA